MKLATYKDGSRDGQLVVVSRDLSTAHYPTGIANRLQQVLADWTYLPPPPQGMPRQFHAAPTPHHTTPTLPPHTTPFTPSNH